MTNSQGVPPPGKSPLDPGTKDIDAVGFALAKVGSHLMWAEEHLRAFESQRAANPALAEQELRYLVESIRQAREHWGRLKELTLAGYPIDRTKRLPEGLNDL